MSTFQYILVLQLFRSVSTCPNRKVVFLLIQICNSPLESAREACKQFAQQQIESCVGFVISNTLLRHFLQVLHCFGIFSTILDMVFKAEILQTCDFFERQASRTSPALLSVSPAASIAYQIRVLEAIGTVKHKGSGL